MRLARPRLLTDAVTAAGTTVDEMVELLCVNLQKDDLAALNASMSAEGLSQKQQQDILTVRSPSPSMFCTRPQCSITSEKRAVITT